MSFGQDFLYNQKPIDYTHLILLIAAFSPLSFNFIFPKSIFSQIANAMTVIGVIAHAVMCGIDFVLWSYGDDYESRNLLIKHLMETPEIWIPFFTIGPGFLYAGVATHAWAFIKSNTLIAVLAMVGAISIGIGQIMGHQNALIIGGCILFAFGMIGLMRTSNKA